MDWVIVAFYVIVTSGAIIASFLEKDNASQERQTPSIVSIYDYK